MDVPKTPEAMNPAIIHHMVQDCANIFGLTPEAVVSKSRIRACCIARAIIADIGYNEFLFTYQSIGKILNRDHATLISGIAAFKQDARMLPELLAYRNQVFNNVKEYLQSIRGPYICE